MAIDEKDQQTLTEIVAGIVKPLNDRLAAQDTVIKTQAAELEQYKTLKVDFDKLKQDEDERWSKMPRRLLNGQVFPLGTPEGSTLGGGAPGFVRPDSLGDKPYSFGRLALAIMEKNEKKAPLEVHISDQLRDVMYMGGLSKAGGRSYWVPLTASDAYFAADSQAASSLKSLIRDAMPTHADPYEMRSIAEQVGLITRDRHSGEYGLKGLKAMDPLDETQGGAYMPFPERGMLIELLRRATIFGPAGAQQIGLPPGGLDYPKEKGINTFQRLPAATTIPSSLPGTITGSVRLIPKAIQGLVRIPNTLIRFSNPAVEGVVRRSLVADLAVRCDYDYLNGAGGTGTPTGLLRYARSAVADTPTKDFITTHTAGTTGTDGDTFAVTDPDMMVSLVEEAPDPEGATAWVMFPREFWKIAGRRADAVTTGDGAGLFLFPVTRGAMSGAVQKELLNIQVITSTQVPPGGLGGPTVTGIVKASGTGLTVVILGNFRRSVIGRVGAVEIASSVDAGFVTDETVLRVIAYDDFAVLNPESFVICDQLVIG